MYFTVYGKRNTYLLMFFVFVYMVDCKELYDNVAVNNFRDYLRINTAHPHPDYEPGIAWVEKQAKELNLEFNLVRGPESKEEFALWLTWPGLNPTLESIVLYSHMDVVAVDSGWVHKPFGGEMDDAGNIYGRGAQDMKSAGVQYLEAIRNLKAIGVTPNRTIHVAFFPGEEVDSKGMKLFVSTPEFMNLNVGFILDEGLPNEDRNEFSVYVGQRNTLWIKFTAHGKSGHGSLLLNDTAAEKIGKVINKMLGLREFEKQRYEGNDSLKLGDVTTINLVYLKGGIGVNIIPAELSVQFDIRVTLSWTYEDMIKLFNDTCKEAGPNVTFEVVYSSYTQSIPVTKLNNNSWWWAGFQKVFKTMTYTIVPRIFPAGSDGLIARRLGIPTLGFSPIYNTTMQFHDRDEFLNAEVYMKGIEIYQNLIQELAYVPAPPPPSTTTSMSVVQEGGSKTTLAQHASNMSTTTIKPPKGKSSAPSLQRNYIFAGIVATLSCYLVY